MVSGTSPKKRNSRLASNKGFNYKKIKTNTRYKGKSSIKSKKHKLKIGLALGSGGARGLAHIGVIKQLLKNNIKIDYIVGSSAGALIGAYFSLYGEIESLEKIALSLTKKDLIKLIDPINPKKGLIAGNKITNFIRKLFDDKSFEDTKIPLVIIATDLEQGKEFYFTSGKLVDAIRASISIPGIFAPFKYNGRYLVDGGLINATPVDKVRSMGADLVIAVDLTMSNAVILNNPSLITVLLRSLDILRTELTKSKIRYEDTVLIRPFIMMPNDYKEHFKFYNAEKFIKLGEEASEKSIYEIIKKINALN